MNVLIAIGGHTGTGKTTLAYALKRSVPLLEPAVLIEDDQVRRELLGVGLDRVLGPEDYGAGISTRVVAEIDRQTKTALAMRYPVINSSGFFAPQARYHVEDMAKRAGSVFCGLWLVAPLGVMKARIAARVEERKQLDKLSVEKGHASDADERVIEKFGDIGVPESPLWTVLDSGKSADDVLAQATEIVMRAMLGRRG